MTGSTHQLNGVLRVDQARPSGGHLWPMLIVGLLCLNATIVGATVYFATSDESVATEPDYYAKALRYEDTIRQRGINEQLGWRISPTLRAAADGRSMELAAELIGRDGRPIADARIEAVAFASVRSRARQSLALKSLPTHAGEYAAPIRIDRSGQWCFRFTATRDGQTFTSETTLLVPELATSASPRR